MTCSVCNAMLKISTEVVVAFDARILRDGFDLNVNVILSDHIQCDA